MKKLLHHLVALVAIFFFVGSVAAQHHFVSQRQWFMNESMGGLKQRSNAPARIAENSVLGPTDTYGMLTGPDGTEWTYTADFLEEGGFYKRMSIKIYDSKNQFVSEIADTLFLEGTLGVRQVDINSLITKKFFNNDNNYEVILHMYANTADYKGRHVNHIYSIGSQKATKVCEIEGTYHLSENLSINSYTEAYSMIFQRNETVEGKSLYHYDVYSKATYASNYLPKLEHTFTVDYAYIASSGGEPSPILLVNNAGKANYVLAQYEIPYFTYSDDLNQDLIVNEGNNLVIKYYDDTFNLKHETKIPVVLTLEYLYSFPCLGNLGISSDVIVNYNGGNTPAYIITVDNYQVSSDSYVSSFYLYDVEGNKLATLAEKTIGRIPMSNIPGQPMQWLFLKDEGYGLFSFVDFPSGNVAAEFSIVTKDELILSTSIDRYPAGDSYQYVVPLLQGEMDKDGNVLQKIAWINRDGEINHFDVINLGVGIESASLYIDNSALNPWLFNTDEAREYMALVYRPVANSSEKEEALVVCNTKGEKLLDIAPSEANGGDLKMIYLINLHTSPSLMCAFGDDQKMTLHYTALPLNSTALEGEGTIQNPYLLKTPHDFTLIDNNPDACYKLANDINFMYGTFGGVKSEFSGKLDGANFELYNLMLDGGGLFSVLKDSAEIKDITIKNAILTANKDIYYAGILAATVVGNFTEAGVGYGCSISNIHVMNPIVVVENSFVGTLGGLFGDVSLFTNISNVSLVNAVISSKNAESVGGVCGKTATSTIMNACAFVGDIEAAGVVGGLIGMSSADDVISNCHIEAGVSGTNIVGGVVGESERSRIENCYIEGSLTLNSTKGSVGGVIGKMGSTLSEDIDTIVFNNLVDIDEFVVPAANDELYVHRIVGFSNVNSFEYDYDNLDSSKPKEEWPKIYNLPEKCLKHNYVISELPIFDSTIEANDTTTEGATLQRNLVTIEWLAEHNFLLGEDVAAPWAFEAADDIDLRLWFEDAVRLESDVDNVRGESETIVWFEGEDLVANGPMYIFNLNGILLARGENRMNLAEWPLGIYIVKTNAGVAKIALK